MKIDLNLIHDMNRFSTQNTCCRWNMFLFEYSETCYMFTLTYLRGGGLVYNFNHCTLTNFEG